MMFFHIISEENNSLSVSIENAEDFRDSTLDKREPSHNDIESFIKLRKNNINNPIITYYNIKQS